MAETGSLFETLFEAEKPLSNAPNPKPSNSDKKGFGTLASLYTAYSTEFSGFALNKLQSLGCSTILDPFSGMGSLGEAARTSDISLILNDLNPFAALACVARSSRRNDQSSAINALRLAVKQLRRLGTTPFERVSQQILSNENLEIKDLFSSPARANYAPSAIAIFILCIARIDYHKSKTGTNPTWTRKLETDEVKKSEFIKMLESAIERAEHYFGKLSPCNESFEVRVTRNNVLKSQFGTTADAIVTSPPYPNRIDYIKHYLPASDLLINLLGLEERSIREKQIGTPLIRPIPHRATTTSSIDDLINQIKGHDSYASESYYWKGFYYYFSDMDLFFKKAFESLSDKGMLLFVVQDTFYKDIPIPVADLLTELAEKRGFSFVDSKKWSVPTRLSSMSPHVQKKKITKKPSETVVFVSK